MTAIFGAMEEEIREIVRNMENVNKITWKNFRIYRGFLGKNEIIVAKTGIGKVLSAMFTQYIIDSFSPEALIFTGIAGALNGEYRIGDIVIGLDCIQHDMDVTPLGLRRGQIPYSGYCVIKSDRRLVRAAEGFKIAGSRIFHGRILTGDQFIVDGHAEEFLYLKKELGGDAVEMEGASTGLVSFVNNIPFILVRIISDKADGRAVKNFSVFLKKASGISVKIVKHILNNYYGN